MSKKLCIECKYESPESYIPTIPCGLVSGHCVNDKTRPYWEPKPMCPKTLCLKTKLICVRGDKGLFWRCPNCLREFTYSDLREEKDNVGKSEYVENTIQRLRTSFAEADGEQDS